MNNESKCIQLWNFTFDVANQLKARDTEMAIVFILANMNPQNFFFTFFERSKNFVEKSLGRIMIYDDKMRLDKKRILFDLN